MELGLFSGEGLLYVRGNPVPEVTLVLAPPDVDGAFDKVDRMARSLARLHLYKAPHLSAPLASQLQIIHTRRQRRNIKT